MKSLYRRLNQWADRNMRILLAIGAYTVIIFAIGCFGSANLRQRTLEIHQPLTMFIALAALLKK